MIGIENSIFQMFQIDIILFNLLLARVKTPFSFEYCQKENRSWEVCNGNQSKYYYNQNNLGKG